MKLKIRRNLGAILLAVVLLVTPLTTVFAVATDESAVGAEQIAQLDSLVTRGRFAMMLSEAFMLEAAPGTENFFDVPDDHPYASGILSARAHGYMVGNSMGYFFPDSVISGAEAAVLLNNMIGFDGSRVTPVQDLAIPDWAVASASVLLDLTMLSAALIELPQLTMADAAQVLGAAAVALMIPQGTPYALVQAELRDNFFSYINRQFLATGTFNPGDMIASPLSDIGLLVRQQQQVILQEILENPNHARGSDEWRIRELYNMFLDNETRTASISKLEPFFDTVRAAESIDELLEVARRYSDLFALQPFYALSFVRDARVDATQWAAIIVPGSLDLGAREFYVDDESLAGIHAAYKGFLAALLSYIGETENLEERAAAIFAIEQSRAALIPPSEAMVDPQAIFVETTWEEVKEATSVTQSLSFQEELFELALGMNVYSPAMDYIRFIESLYVEENLQALRDVALIRVLSTFMHVLGDEVSALGETLHAAMFGEVGGDRLSLEERSQQFVTSMMWRTFSRMYYQRFSSEEIKRDVTEMIEDIRAMMRGMIGTLTWMSPETQATAVEKLDAVRAFVAFPDTPVEEIAFQIRAQAEGGCLIELTIDLASLNQELSIEMLRGPANVDIWTSIPTSTVNAFYSGMDNAIIIPAGILQYPVFSPDAPRERNLGGIGAIIAHEFTHAFDPMGSQFDKDGTLTNWWADEDFAAFNELTDNVAEILDAISFGGVNLNGAFSAGETIADLGAMEAVLAVAAGIPGADLSLVMESWARIWAARMSPEVATFMIFNSPHLPMKLRANFILAQLNEFYEVFGIVEGDGMYIPEGRRLSFWF
ncbi:MAG: M13 family metallopeptidase [Oscillospiraceae bacterium]|nr:M13 family metallopeptidase [Oscillospiraceae bacterium]